MRTQPLGTAAYLTDGHAHAHAHVQGVALARRYLRRHGRDVCVVLEAVGVEVVSAREGSTAMHRCAPLVLGSALRCSRPGVLAPWRAAGQRPAAWARGDAQPRCTARAPRNRRQGLTQHRPAPTRTHGRFMVVECAVDDPTRQVRTRVAVRLRGAAPPPSAQQHQQHGAVRAHARS